MKRGGRVFLGMAVVSISLPDPLLASLDRAIEKRGYRGRSDFIRASLREFVAQQGARDVAGRRTATLTLVYPEGHERRFSELRHAFGDVVRTMIHGHAGETCVEVFVLEGKGERVQSFADTLRGAREARQVSLTFTDQWEEQR